MQIILLEDIDKVGKSGEVVDVRDGYARNFLIPKGVALVLTKSNMKMYEDRKRRESVRLGKEKDKAMEYIEQAYQDSSDWVNNMHEVRCFYPLYDTMKSESEFQEFLKKIGVEEK